MLGSQFNMLKINYAVYSVHTQTQHRTLPSSWKICIGLQGHSNVKCGPISRCSILQALGGYIFINGRINVPCEVIPNERINHNLPKVH